MCTLLLVFGLSRGKGGTAHFLFCGFCRRSNATGRLTQTALQVNELFKANLGYTFSNSIVYQNPRV